MKASSAKSTTVNTTACSARMGWSMPWYTMTDLNARDTTLAFVSRAPQPDIARVKARMGWSMPWYTMTDRFDADFGVDQWNGTNAFIRDGARVFRTYFINNRGDEVMGGTWAYLDLTALGRRRSGRTHPRATRRPQRTSGGTGTTSTARPRWPRAGATRCNAA